jgi:hypothetical protein
MTGKEQTRKHEGTKKNGKEERPGDFYKEARKAGRDEQ